MAPAAPTLTFVRTGNGSATFSINGDAGITNELFYWTSSVTPTSAGTRSGDGEITAIGLTSGTAYLFGAQSFDAGPDYGPMSNILAAVPAVGSATPTGKIASMLVAIRDNFLSSTALTAWIQTVIASGTTTGNVFLGRVPQTNPNVATVGPCVYISRESLRALDAGMEARFTHQLEISADIVWSEDHRASNVGIAQMDPIDQIADEFEAIGNTLTGAFGGQFLGITIDPLGPADEADETLHYARMIFTVWYGSAD